LLLFPEEKKRVDWLGSSDGKGLEVDGQLRFSLVNLGVEEESNNLGVGVQINAGRLFLIIKVFC